MNKVFFLFLGLLISFQSFALTPYKGNYDLYAETVMGNLKIGTAILNLEINDNQFEFTTEASTASVWKALYDYSRTERSIGNESGSTSLLISFSSSGVIKGINSEFSSTSINDKLSILNKFLLAI